jgi:hypothetical protein
MTVIVLYSELIQINKDDLKPSHTISHLGVYLFDPLSDPEHGSSAFSETAVDTVPISHLNNLCDNISMIFSDY